MYIFILHELKQFGVAEMTAIATPLSKIDKSSNRFLSRDYFENGQTKKKHFL